MGKIDDLTGKKYNMLTVIKRYESCEKHNARWVCVCDCGNEKNVMGYHLKSGAVKSCGCIHNVKASDNRVKKVSKPKIDKYCNERLYTIWSGIKRRCYSTSCKDYKNYGSRGITMCDEWFNSYHEFKKWAYENNYNVNYSIDRIDVDGNYEPKNCRWTTAMQQCNNRRNNAIIEYNNTRYTMSELSRKLGIPYQKLYRSIGWLKACKTPAN